MLGQPRALAAGSRPLDSPWRSTWPDLLRGWFTSGGFEEEDRESYLDRLEVVTGRDISGSGVLTVEGTYRLREGFARESDALYVVLERDSYEDYGLGLRLVLRLR